MVTAAAQARPDISLVIPVYNERDNLGPLWEEIRAVLAPLERPFEVLLIDDGSTDGSAEGIDALGREHPEVRPIHFEKNAGQSAAFAAGFRLARAPIVVTLDADLQNDPADIPALVTRLESSGAGAVVGIRAGRRDSLVRKISSKVGNYVRNTLTKDHVTDTGCSLKAYRKDAVARLKMYRGMHRFLPTLIRIEGYEVLEMPVRHRERRHGTSKYGIANRAMSGLADVLAVRWMRARALDYRIRGEEPGDGAEASRAGVEEGTRR